MPFLPTTPSHTLPISCRFASQVQAVHKGHWPGQASGQACQPTGVIRVGPGQANNTRQGQGRPGFASAGPGSGSPGPRLQEPGLQATTGYQTLSGWGQATPRPRQQQTTVRPCQSPSGNNLSLSSQQLCLLFQPGQVRALLAGSGLLQVRSGLLACQVSASGCPDLA